MLRSEMLFVFAGIVVLSGLCCGADYSARCIENGNVTTTLTPSTDGVKARYVLEWCTDPTPDVDEWTFEVTFDHNRLNSCGYREKHSAKTVYLTKMPNCTFVCLGYPLDLLFNACYTVFNSFPQRGSSRNQTVHRISKGYSIQQISEANYSAFVENNGNEVKLQYFTGIVPVDDFDVLLSKRNSSDAEHDLWRKSVYSNCTSSTYQVTCRLRLEFGNYSAMLMLQGAWVDGSQNFKKHSFKKFSVFPPARVDVPGGGGAGAALAWAGGALAALSGAALALLLALHRRRAAAGKEQVQRDWLNREKSKPAAPEPKPAGPILLLYARECAQAEPVIAALKDLLELAAPGQVYDINSPETLALAAAGGGSWVRGVVRRAGARVVVLQTPALRALHAAPLRPDGLRLEQPLLGSRAAYRAPAAGDWLLGFALRLLADTAHGTPHITPYKKYYLARLDGLETDALPHAVPFRRYVLPQHALTLLHDLAPQLQLQLKQSDANGLPLKQSDANGLPLKHPEANGLPLKHPEANGLPVKHPEANGLPLKQPEANGLPLKQQTDVPQLKQQTDVPQLKQQTDVPQLQPQSLALHRADVLAHAAVSFRDYVTANPDYLTYELMFL